MARQVQTVLVSVLVHAAVLVLLVVIPLLAMDGLPDIAQLTTRYVPVEMKPPEMPAAPVPTTVSSTPTADVASVPTEAPRTITAETPARVPAIANIDAAPGGLGIPGASGNPNADILTVPTPPQPRQVEPVRPGGNVKAPTRTVNVAPVYPPVAIAAKISGVVLIEAIIGTDGSVRDARVIRSVPLLDDAALAAVRQWKYTPTTLNGIAVPVVMTVSVRFELGG